MERESQKRCSFSELIFIKKDFHTKINKFYLAKWCLCRENACIVPTQNAK